MTDGRGDETLKGERGALAIESLGKRRYRVHLPPMDYLNLLAPHRHGEVAMIIERAPGWVLLQTKANYPPGTFRIPTGTIQRDEPPEECMRRELLEEANLTPGRSEELFRLEYRPEGGRSDFVTFGYLIQDPVGELMPIDKKEAITGWREAQIAELPDVARDLRRLEAPRAGWGLFRSAIHQLLAQIMLGIMFGGQTKQQP